MRAQNPRTLGDLVGGDCCKIKTGTGPVEVQIGFRIGDEIFVRVRESRAMELIKFPGDLEFIETTYLQPGAMDWVPSDALVRVLDDEVDPVFGIDATDREPLIKRSEKDERRRKRF